MERTCSHIDMDERRKIAVWRIAGLIVEVIAEKLSRYRSTIFREIEPKCSHNLGSAYFALLMTDVEHNLEPVGAHSMDGINQEYGPDGNDD